MGLGFFNTASISPQKVLKKKVSKIPKKKKEIKEYHIDNLVLPSSVTRNDEKEILYFVELILAGETLPRVSGFSINNIEIALSLVESIEEQST